MNFAQDLAVRQVADDLFEGMCGAASPQRAFGGALMAQALSAATAAVAAERTIHYFHARFLRPVDPTRPLQYRVHPESDSRSFSRRAVQGVQDGKAVLQAVASFAAAQADDGPAFQRAMPAVPGPAQLVSERTDPIDVRHVEGDAVLNGRLREPDRQQIWARVNQPLPDRPTVHTSALAWVSDLTLLWLALSANGMDLAHRHRQLATIEHTLWFHRPARADQWLLYAQECVSVSGGLAMLRGEIYSEAGAHVASVAQVGTVRP